MPEMLLPTSKIIGSFGMDIKIGLMTDARFSGGSVGGAPIIGHMEEDGNMRFIEDGDTIIIDPRNNFLELDVTEEILEKRKVNSSTYITTEIHIPMSLRQYARGNPDPRKGSLSIEF